MKIRGGVKMAGEWRKLCKVCDNPVVKGKLEDHKECLDYAKIVRSEKIE